MYVCLTTCRLTSNETNVYNESCMVVYCVILGILRMSMSGNTISIVEEEVSSVFR